MRTILITGGCGFIGINLIHHILKSTNDHVVNLDALTYAADPSALDVYKDNDRYTFIRGDIQNRALLKTIFQNHKPHCVMNLAAESHVDKSISTPEIFVQTNVCGTFALLSESLHFYEGLGAYHKENFRFHHISTDEVFGSLGGAGFFNENTKYDPRSPYSASKAASDHFVRAFSHTYNLPVLITNCSNNYGPHQHDEKLIPNTIKMALNGEKIPIYGDGKNIRDWLFVDDHVLGLMEVLNHGCLGETYLIGGNCEKTNIDIVTHICKILDMLKPLKSGKYKDLIEFVEDRKGHDFRYAVDPKKIKDALGWFPKTSFDDGLQNTINWYIEKFKSV